MQINRDILNTLMNDVGEENAELILDSLASELVAQSSELQEAAGTMSLENIRQVAHKLKNTAATLGAGSLSEVCATIERTARNGESEECACSMESFEALAVETEKELTEIRSALFGVQ